MGNLDFQNPQSGVRVVLEVTQVAAAMDRMGEVADPVSLDVEVQVPAHGLGLFFGVAVELEANDLVVFPVCLHAVEQVFGGVGAGDHVRVVASGECGAGVTFVALPYRAHVDEEDVVVAQYRVAFGALLEGLEGVGAEAHQQRVPDALHVEVGEYLLAQFTGFGLQHAGADALGQLFDGLPGHRLGVTHGVNVVGGAYGFLGLCGHRYLLGLGCTDRYAFYYIAIEWQSPSAKMLLWRAPQICNQARLPNTTATPAAVYDIRFNHSRRVSNVIAASEIAI